MNDPNLEQRLAAVAVRLRRVEQALALPPITTWPVPPQPAPVAASVVVAKPPPLPSGIGTTPPPTTTTLVNTAMPPPTRATAKPPPRQGQLEQTIGLKWAGWVGAVVLVI